MTTIVQAKALWEAVLGDLQLRVTRPSFETWLKDTVGLTHEDTELTIGAPNAFVAEMLEQRMYSLISQAVERVAKTRLEVRFQVVCTNGSPAVAVGGTSPLSAPEIQVGDVREAVHGSPGELLQTSGAQPGLNPGYTFGSFIVGKSNELAHAAALAVSERPGASYNPLFIYSGVGLGKTHLLHAIGHIVAAKGLSLIYATTEAFTNEYIKAIREGKTEEFRSRYRGADVLLLDDIQFIIGKEQTQEGFFHTFNALHMANRQIVITSDRPAASLTLLEDRVRSRLAGGLVVDIQSPDLETRLAILRSKAEETGQAFPTDVLEFLAERLHKNIRELGGALTRIAAYAHLRLTPITLDMVKTAIADAITPQERRSVSDKTIVEAVSSYFAIDMEALTGRRRDKPTALARQVAMYLLREETRLGLTTIGRIMGGKDHTTVMYACSKVAKQIDIDPHLRQDVINIRESLSTR